MSFSNIFVVIDPTVEQQIALRKAEQLALDTGATLHLFCCSYEDDLSDFASRKDAKHSCLEDLSALLTQCAEPLRKEGIKVTKEAYWNADWRQSIVRAAQQRSADLVVKSYSRHNPLARHVVANSDFTLMRDPNCATLLVKGEERWLNQVVLAAVTMEDDDDQHRQLNHQIMVQAKQLAAAGDAALHVVSVFSSKEKATACATEGLTPEQTIGKAFAIDEDRVHLAYGNTPNAISDCQASCRADVLVIGTVARRGVEGVIVGNTAEKVLDSIESDILVVNP